MHLPLRTILIALVLWLTAGLAFARGGGGCVQQGGLVDTPGGERAIESLVVGDAVWSWCDGKRVEARVLACYQVEPETFIDITIAGRRLHVTGEHPIATSPGVFRQARQLRVGDRALVWRGGSLVDSAIESVATRDADKPAFNLSVYPGGQFVADGVLVHNKGGGCFLPHTPVLLGDGSVRAIGDIKPGDKVLALSPEERVVEAEVKRVFTLPAEEYWVVAADRGSVEVTGEHPFYVGAGVFRTAESLRVGDAVYSRDGPGVSVQRVESMRRVFRGVTVVNLQTDEPHTFFAAGFAVHNKGGGGGCFPAGTKIATPMGDVTIERIATGSTVYAVDESGDRVAVRVASLIVQRDFVLTLTTSGGVLHTTSEHPLYVGNGRFSAAGEVAVGAVIYRHDGKSLVPATVQAKRTSEKTDTVYNLSVDEPNTFIADGFVVHNKGGSSFRSSGGSSIFRSTPRPTTPPIIHRAPVYVPPPRIHTTQPGSTTRYSSTNPASYSGNYGTGSQSPSPVHGPSQSPVYDPTAWNHSTGLGRSGIGWIVGFLPWIVIITVFGFILRKVISGLTQLSGNRGGQSSFGSGSFNSDSGDLDEIVGVNDVVVKSEPTERLLAALAKSDDSFDKEQIRSVVVEAFNTLQLCWTERNYTQMRRLVTADLARQHEKQIETLIRQREINRIENIRILRTDFVHVIATQKPKQKQVTVLITAQMSDYYVDDRTDRFRRGNRSVEAFQEYWTFTWENSRWALTEIEQVRESDALKEKNLVEGYDTEAAELAGRGAEPSFRDAGPTKSGNMTKKVQQLSAADPLWRADKLSSAARTAFMTVMAAREAGDAGQISERDFTKALARELSAEITAAVVAKQEVEYRNLCVRKVQLVHINDGVLVKPASFTARITAHAQTVRKQAGEVTSEDPFVMTFVEYYTFTRDGGAWRASEIKGSPVMVSEAETR